MKFEIVHSLTENFEGYAQQTNGGVEFWLARDLQHLLGYSEWRNFLMVVNKAKAACEVSGHSVDNHFVDVNKMVRLGSGSEREIEDIMLIRPESLPPEEDVKKVERRIASEDKKSLGKPEALEG
nr:hypothetical protein [Coraliomargarita parva]